ncbi:class II fructose-bisphosphate aldolase [Streptomyces nojiriensis]|uniref:class II fructose-bisphosphate aldolase n=1 Tax=Streptomyces nojiriensis TaxID=66374 RepID=UPI002E179E0F
MDLRFLLRDGPPIPAFNFNDQFDLAAAVEAFEAHGRPGILMVSMNAMASAGLEFLHDIFLFHRRRASQRLFIELDHCSDEATLVQAAELGFDMVMADFSQLALEDNIKRVARLTGLLAGTPCLVEAAPTEIPAAEDSGTSRPEPTSPDCLRTFASETGCDVVAPHLGTLHGFDRQKPSLDFARVAELTAASPVPLAAHGCDFLAPGQLAGLAGAGVRKLNVGPQLRVAWCVAARAAWADCDLDAPDQRQVHAVAGRAMRSEAEAIIDEMGRGYSAAIAESRAAGFSVQATTRRR